jgi:hypothetical protein
MVMVEMYGICCMLLTITETLMLSVRKEKGKVYNNGNVKNVQMRKLLILS